MSWEETKRKRDALFGYLTVTKIKNRILDKIQEERMNEMFKSLQNDGMPHGHNSSDMSDYAVRLSELEERLSVATEAQTRILEEIERGCRKLEPEERVCIIKRCIFGVTVEDLAKKQGVCKRTIQEISRKAFEHIEIKGEYIHEWIQRAGGGNRG